MMTKQLAASPFSRPVPVFPSSNFTSHADFGDEQNAHLSMIRLNSTGKLDTTFGTIGRFVLQEHTQVDMPGHAVIQLANGKILAGGEDQDLNGQGFLLRLNPDGTIDSSFGTNGVQHPHGYAVQEFLPAKHGMTIVVHEDRLIRMNADGRIAKTFGGITDVPVHRVIPLHGGKFAGVAGPYYNIYRFTTNGQLDETFGDRGVATISLMGGGTHGPEDVVAQADGKLLAIVDLKIVRFNTDGSVDPSFGDNGTIELPGNALFAGALTPSGRLLVAGYEPLTKVLDAGPLLAQFVLA